MHSAGQREALVEAKFRSFEALVECRIVGADGAKAEAVAAAGKCHMRRVGPFLAREATGFHGYDHLFGEREKCGRVLYLGEKDTNPFECADPVEFERHALSVDCREGLLNRITARFMHLPEKAESDVHVRGRRPAEF